MEPFGAAGSRPQTWRASRAKHTGREILNGICYAILSGGAWKLLPHDLPAQHTVYHYFWSWRRRGIFKRTCFAVVRKAASGTLRFCGCGGAICGISLGSPMNLMSVIAVYAAISREIGLPFRFFRPPESVYRAPYQYGPSTTRLMTESKATCSSARLPITCSGTSSSVLNLYSPRDGTHKDRQWTMRNVIERLAAIRREKIVMGAVEFEKVTTPEPDQQTILDYLKVRL